MLNRFEMVFARSGTNEIIGVLRQVRDLEPTQSSVVSYDAVIDSLGFRGIADIYFFRNQSLLAKTRVLFLK